jgi:hypothetical protein
MIGSIPVEFEGQGKSGKATIVLAARLERGEYTLAPLFYRVYYITAIAEFRSMPLLVIL